MTANEVPKKVRRYLPPRGVLAIALGVALATTLVLLARSVVRNDLTAFDAAIIAWVRQFDSPTMDVVMRVFTTVGSAAGVGVIVVLVAGYAAHRRRRALAGLLVMTALGAGVVNTLAKLSFQRARPDLFFEMIPPTSFSFPSGHSTLSAAAFGMVAVVVLRLSPSRALHRVLVALTPLLVLMVGVSRVYLGAHWPTDVLAGFAAGMLVLMSGVLALRYLERVRDRSAQAGELSPESPAWR